jgi:hypothetical protein
MNTIRHAKRIFSIVIAWSARALVTPGLLLIPHCNYFGFRVCARVLVCCSLSTANGSASAQTF